MSDTSKHQAYSHAKNNLMLLSSFHTVFFVIQTSATITNLCEIYKSVWGEGLCHNINVKFLIQKGAVKANH